MKRLLQHPLIRSHLSRSMRFALAGGLGAVMDFSLLNFLVWWLGLDPRFANIFSTFFASIVVFLLNKFFAFRDRRGDARSQALRFLLVYVMAYVLNVVFTALYITAGIHLLHLPLTSLLSNGSKALAIGTVMCWNYVLLHRFVFR